MIASTSSAIGLMITVMFAGRAATLDNLNSGQISEEEFIGGRPSLSMWSTNVTEEGTCSVEAMGDHLASYPEMLLPPDLGIPRHVSAQDLQDFGGQFPSLAVTEFVSSSEGPLVSALSVFIENGSGSDDYEAARELEHSRLQMTDFPFEAGRPYIASFEDLIANVGMEFSSNRQRYNSIGFRFGYGVRGTATLVRFRGRLFAVTAAHIFGADEALAPHDLAIIPLAENSNETGFLGQFVAEIPELVESTDLKDQWLQIYFNRDCGKQHYVTTSGQRFVYDVMPTALNQSDGQLFANVPNDFVSYMGGVSGAGVFAEDSLVGVFLGVECFGVEIDGSRCHEATLGTRYMRFVGIDRLRAALVLHTEATGTDPVLFF